MPEWRHLPAAILGSCRVWAKCLRGGPANGISMVTSMLFEKIRSALRLVVLDEDGAVTVDWVVLSAAIIGVGMVVLTPIAYQTDSASEQVADYIAGVHSGYGSND